MNDIVPLSRTESTNSISDGDRPRAREVQSDPPDPRLVHFAERVTLIAAMDDTIAVPQSRIYDEHLEAIQDLLARDRSKALEPREGQRKIRKSWVLKNSFARVTDPSRLTAEFEAALSHALKSSKTGFDEYKKDAQNENFAQESLTRQRGIHGVTRYNDESVLIKRSAADIQKSMLRDEDEVGVRCLARFDDGKPSDEAKKLYELYRRFPLFKDADHVRGFAAASIREKYPVSTSYFNWEEGEGAPAVTRDQEKHSSLTRPRRSRVLSSLRRRLGFTMSETTTLPV